MKKTKSVGGIWESACRKCLDEKVRPNKLYRNRDGYIICDKHGKTHADTFKQLEASFREHVPAGLRNK